MYHQRVSIVIVIALIVALAGCGKGDPQTVRSTTLAPETAGVTREVTRPISGTVEGTRVGEPAVTATLESATPTAEPADEGPVDVLDGPTFTPTVASAEPQEPVYQTGFDEWLASEGHFSGWQKSGAHLTEDGELVLDPATAISEADPYADGTYYGGNFYAGRTYWVGEATSPAIAADFDFDELIPSWNAATPLSTWVEVLARVELDGRWTKWYNLGIWASGQETIRRHSVELQGDADADVAVDTLIISAGEATADGYQLKVRLFSVDGEATPRVRYLSAAYSTTPPENSEPSTGTPAYWDTLLAVPECSQMLYPNGGSGWCSPTSVSMVVSYWKNDGGPCEPGVRAAAAGTYDWVYDGTGNWPFNTAYAATLKLHGSVRRFSSIEEIEAWVARGVPVVIGFAWGEGELTGAALPSSAGHLAVVVGFDSQGNPIVNDPAADTNEGVQRTYLRSELESLWLEEKGGTVYLIKP